MTEFSLPWMDDFHSSPQIGTESDSRVINLVVNFNEFAMPWMVLLIPTISHRISSIHQLPSNQASKEGRIHPGFIENLPHLYIYICIMYLSSVFGGGILRFTLYSSHTYACGFSSIHQLPKGRKVFHPESPA
jgi:hypothetical protein